MLSENVKPKSILFYDADCAFCTNAAKWAETRTRGQVEFLPLQEMPPAALGLTSEEWYKAAWWIDGYTAPERGSRAVGHVLVQCGFGWRIVGILCLMQPTSLFARGVYAIVAKFRRYLPDGSQTCDIHTTNR